MKRVVSWLWSTCIMTQGRSTKILITRSISKLDEEDEKLLSTVMSLQTGILLQSPCNLSCSTCNYHDGIRGEDLSFFLHKHACNVSQADMRLLTRVSWSSFSRNASNHHLRSSVSCSLVYNKPSWEEGFPAKSQDRNIVFPEEWSYLLQPQEEESAEDSMRSLFSSALYLFWLFFLNDRKICGLFHAWRCRCCPDGSLLKKIPFDQWMKKSQKT